MIHDEQEKVSGCKKTPIQKSVYERTIKIILVKSEKKSDTDREKKEKKM